MAWVVIDIEADGPIPGDYSMVSIGAVVVDASLERTFYGRLRPISEQYVAEALTVAAHTREETLTFDDPAEVMRSFVTWLEAEAGPAPRFVSDNNGFDWMFVCWYLHHFVGENPFGHSSTNLGSLYKGLVKDMRQSFKHLRRTAHTHHPVDDAKGNAEALLQMQADLGLAIKL